MPLNGGTLNGFGGLSGSGSDLTANSLWGCELRAALAGYRSDTISLASRRYMDNPDVGTIVLHNLTNVKGFTTSATTAFAPKDARKAFDKAGEAIQRSRPDDAQKELLKAVGMYPKFAAAWYELGRVYERRDHFDEARDAYTKAIAADGNYVNPYERLYLLAAKDAKWQEVAETTDRVLRLNPYDFPGAYYYNALANTQLKKFDAAEKSAREAAKLSGPQAEPRSYYVLGVILANKGDFGASAESLRTFLKASPATPDRDRIEKMISEVDGLAQAKAAALDPR
jgi:tetratricopeptide (TPR) repeat protein